MNYIIDGHNLIGKLPGMSLSMPDDEQRLVELLTQFGRGRQHRLEVYFDGAPVGQAGAKNYGKVRAYFVPASSTADHAIRSRLEQLGKSAKNWTVVTSDREVQAAARHAHTRVLGAEEFADVLQASLRANVGNVDISADQSMSDAEMNEWLKIFGQGSKKK